MELRPSYPLTWSTVPRGNRPTMSKATALPVRTPSTNWRKPETFALLHSTKYQQALRRYQARRIRSRDQKVGDLVLRLRQSNKGRHKLTPPWEGPYIVAQVLKPRTYKLANEKGKILTNAWNIEQLHRFYP